MIFEDLSPLSPFPIVDLSEPKLPADGFHVALSGACHRNFARSPLCREHYRALASAQTTDVPVACPFGFASFPVRGDGFAVALTGVIPFPRLGGDRERLQAKRHPHHKVAVAALERASKVLRHLNMHIAAVAHGTVQRQSLALHEIRKLNRNVKQAAERLCRQDNPLDPDEAAPELVKIWKTSELMSNQFEVTELLANESLASLPLNSTSELYKIFDKCVRIYRRQKDRIVISAPAGYSPRIKACDKTFPIIASVLIENAVKYSPKDTPVKIELQPDGSDGCVVTVTNLTFTADPLPDKIFQKGVRATKDYEGSGNGLYVAQLVARQHGAEVGVQNTPVGGRNRATFSVRFATLR